MYLHLGQDTVVRLDEIVGIFDMDTSTISKHSRQFLTDAEKAAGYSMFLWNCPSPLWFVWMRMVRRLFIYRRYLQPPCANGPDSWMESPI